MKITRKEWQYEKEIDCFYRRLFSQRVPCFRGLRRHGQQYFFGEHGQFYHAIVNRRYDGVKTNASVKRLRFYLFVVVVIRKGKTVIDSRVDFQQRPNKLFKPVGMNVDGDKLLLPKIDL